LVGDPLLLQRVLLVLHGSLDQPFGHCPVVLVRSFILIAAIKYTSKEFKRITDKANLIHSMSCPGRCLDNAPIEGFWGSLKCEMYYLSKFGTYEELEKAIALYVHFYNTSRYQKRLKGLSPLEYRAQAA